MNPSKRRKGRRYAVQGIYQWQLTDNNPASIYESMLVDVNLNKTDLPYMEELITKVPRHLEEIDQILEPSLSRTLAEVDPVERAILRIATYEFLKHPEIPYRVVINEAIEQAKTFGAEDGHKFVNGVLDKISTQVRAEEVNASKKQ
ncbi:MAG: transcription antitermination factor NusB [Gammaproteobacteria bacterium]|nr:MAG: transcription antitermination factor NusB [Gammaproteobacteria bacterium]